ncbi:class I SAM-dependent methyltransferase [Phytoactinopolyspora mesophila]|uniref:Methyltransferase domain-containing protein n=1 Tax=Phytoactinopolyspora mesophila TaxID=2650750 RepID=A0A7K3M4W0_9ACTN|nr:class I SAM-dependent methyltransferase [Phytoactinopolyspora mesophila]NDL58286.1 methyltransferase domain-containing protein [Phytoactinopolyspora mesophila]
MTQNTANATVSSTTAAAWMRRWDEQQEFYVADREERFAVICDIVETAVADVAEPVVVDLGCGPGSLAARLHERIPAAAIIGIDSDPLLLGLARSHYREGIEWVDDDLASPSWRRRLPSTVHAAVSTTALHWLTSDELEQMYRALGEVIEPGGVVVNGDHLGIGDARMQALAETVRNRRAVRAGVQDNEEWRSWWDTILAEPEFGELARARAERFDSAQTASNDGDEDAHSHHGNGLTVGEQSDMLRAAGFSSVAPLWQVGDDHVLVAVR